MQILAALFIDDLAMRQVPGPATRLDLLGVQFSAAAPQPVPYTWTPHLVVVIRCAADESGTGALEIVFSPEGSDEVLARNVQPVQIEPGRFGRYFVRPEILFEDYRTIEAHCRIDLGPVTVVPFTLLAPVSG